MNIIELQLRYWIRWNCLLKSLQSRVSNKTNLHDVIGSVEIFVEIAC
jgi:hypothetical protein